MRSRRGCLVCRRRKVKCDEHWPTCSRCSRLGLACEWRTDESAVGAAPLQRSRQSQACQRCSGRRMRCEPCNPSLGRSDCRACYAAKVQCVKRGPPLQVEASSLPPPAEVDRLVDAYFRGPHHFCFYTFIHPETFRRLHAQGRIPIALLLAILATALRCIEPDSQLADEWAHRSHRLVMDDTFSRMSALNLQTILLLARYHWHLGAHSSASLLAAMAQRMAYDLQLNREPRRKGGDASGALPELILETRRRLMWSTFVLQDLPDAGGHQPTSPSVSIDPRTITVYFPSGDSRYIWKQADSEVERPMSGELSPVMMPLLVIRNRSLQYSVTYHPRNEVSSELECPWRPGSQFASLLADLDAWGSSLPSGLYFNQENLRRSTSNLTAFLTLHCIFHVVYTDLFGVGYFLRRRMLEQSGAAAWGEQPPENFLVYCDLERRKHASRILSLLAEAKPHLQQQPEPFVAICAGVAFRILCLEPALSEADASEAWLWPSQHHINVAFDWINSSAKWSRPIHRLIHALAQSAAKKGIQVDTEAFATDTQIMRANTSCPASPTMRHLGTDAAIRSYLATSDRELIPPEDGEMTGTEAKSSTHPSMNTDLGDSTILHQGSPPSGTFHGAEPSHGLSPAAQEMLDFWWTRGPDQTDSPDVFDLGMWLDLDNCRDS